MRRKLLLFLSVFCLLCTSKADVRYALSPVGFEDGTIPSDWTQISIEGTGNWQVEGGADVSLTSPAGAKSGNYRVAIRRASGTTTHSVTRLITSAVNLTDFRNPELHFAYAQAASYAYFDTLRVYYRTTATAQWTLLKAYTEPSEKWQTASLELPSYMQGTAYQVAFEASDNSGHGVVLDDISILQPSMCEAPQFLAIQPTSTTAYVEYASGGTGYGSTADLFDIVVSDSALADPAAATAAEVAYMQKGTAETSLTLTGLNNYTTYYAYLRTNCSDNASGYTDWTSETFQTAMLKSLPFNEDFNYAKTTSNYATVAGWTFGNNFDAVSVPYVYVGTSSSYKQFYSVDSTSYLAFTKAASDATTAIDSAMYVYAATPELDGNLSECEVSFWGTAYKYVYNGVTDYAAELTVGVMTDPTDFSTFTAIKTVTVETAYQFKHFTVSLSGYTGTGKYVALVSNAKKQNVFFVDNVEVKQITTAVPEDVHVYNVVPTGFDIAAQLWAADSWNVKVSTTYVRDASTLTAADCLVNLTGQTGATCHVNSANLAGKTVVVYVQAVKNGVASAWSFPVTVRVPVTGVVPIELTMNTGTYKTVQLSTLNNEIHGNTTYTALDSIYFAPRGFDGKQSSAYYYPEVSIKTPTYDDGHLNLNGIDNYFTFPYVENIDSLMVSFRLAVGYIASSTYAGQSRVAVGVMTDPYDLTTFVELGQFEGGEDSYVKYEQDLYDYKGTGHYVAIRAIKPATTSTLYGSYNALDNIVLKKVPTCRQASNVKVEEHVTEANVSWNANGMSQWLVSVYGDENYSQLVQDTVVTKDTVVIAGLTSNTTYYFTVRTICGTDTLELDDVDQKYLFSTKYGIPFVEKFTNSTIPTDWTQKSGLLSDVFAGTSLSYGSYWSFSSSTSGITTDGYAAKINICQTSKKHWLITPEIYVEAGADEEVRLTFDAALVPYSSTAAANRNNGTDDQFAVVVSTDGGETWTRSNATIWNNKADSTTDYVLNDLPQTMQQVSIDMTKYVGKAVKIGFYAESTVSNADNYLLVDNVKLAKFDVNCQGIKTLSALATGENTAAINWTVTGTQSAHIDVYEDEVKTVAFSGDVTTSPYALTGLKAGTVYNVYAYQSCDAQGDTLTCSFRTDCSKSTVADLGTIDFSGKNSLTCWTVGVGDTTGVGTTALTEPTRKSISKFGYVLYMEKSQKSGSKHFGNNYYAIMPPLDIDSIAKYQVVFDAATTTAASDTANVKKLYVGVITDPNDLSTIEITDTVTLQYAADSMAMKSYAIGFDNYQGDYLGDYGTNVIFMVSAPDNYSDIAIIDNVLLEPVAGCHQVIDMTATDMKVSSATLKWTSEAESFRLVVSDKLCNPDTVSQFLYDQILTDKTATVTGLTANTYYYAYIKAICGVGDSARWSGNTVFKTAYGVPFLEEFSSTTLTDGTWNGYKVQFQSGKDTLDITGTAISTATTGWYMTSVPSGIVGQKDYTARVEVYGSGSYNALLVSPQISLPEAAESEDPLAVSFVVAKSKYSSAATVPQADEATDDKFSVFVSEDGLKWARSASTVWASDGTGDYDFNELSLIGKRYRIDLSAYKGKAIYLGFYTESTVSSPDSYLYLDSVKVDYYKPACDGITSCMVVTDSTNTTSAALKVKTANTSDTIEYVLGVDSVAWATAVAHHADSTLVVLKGLKPSSTYSVYLRTLCASGDTSAWYGPVTLTTACLLSVPVSYDFDDEQTRYEVKMGTYTYPVENCWSVRASSSYYVPDIIDNTSSYFYSYSGTSALRFYKSSGSYYMLAAMPQVDADLDSLQLSFMARAGYEYSSSGEGNGTMSYSTSSYLHSVEIGTMDDLSDTTTFHLIKKIELDAIASSTSVSSDATQFWRQQIISLEGAKGKYIVFYQRPAKSSNYIYIDDVMLSKRTDCKMVENLTVDSIHPTSARVHWTSDAGNYYLTLANNEETKNFALTDTVCALTGLEANTEYTVQVVAICGQDTTLSVQSKFTTLYALPLEEDFTDGLPSDWSTLDGDVLAGETATKNTTTGWRFSDSDIYGINAPKMRWNLGYTSSYERNSLLVTPQVEVNAASTNQVLLNFDMALTANNSASAPSAAYMQNRKFQILVSEDNGTTWNKIDSLVWGTDTTYARRFDSIPRTRTHYSFDFTAYNGKSIRLAFYAYAPASSGYSYLHLTNIKLKEFNPNCLCPENLTAKDKTLKGATLTWSSEAPKFEVKISNDKNFSKLALDSVITDTALVVNTLNPGTKYYVRVRSFCSESEYSDWTETCEFTTVYGLPFVEEFTTISSGNPADWSVYKEVTLSNVLNKTNPFNGATTSTYWGYSSSYCKNALTDANHIGIEIYSSRTNNWLLTPVIDLSKDDKEHIMFSFDAALTTYSGTSKPSSTESQKFYVIVSEDGGQTWKKSNLTTWSDAAADSAAYTMASIPNGLGKNYKFDFSQYAGKSIQVAFGVEATTNDNFLHIDNIRIEGVDNVCFGPRAIKNIAVTANTATIEITPLDTDSAWQYAYVQSGNVLTNATVYNTNKTTFEVKGLNAFTAYDVYVRSLCGAGDTSEWVSLSLYTATELPLVEEFSTISTTQSIPAGWTQYKPVTLTSLLSNTDPFGEATESLSWGYATYNSNALKDANHVGIEIYSSVTNNWLVTPKIDLSKADVQKVLKFSFDAALTHYSSAAKPTSTSGQQFYVAVSEDCGQTWKKANLTIWSDAVADSADYTMASIPTGAGKNYKLDFSQYAGKVIQVAFGLVATSNDNYFHLDNIRLEEVDNACFGAKGLEEKSVTSTTSTIVISPAEADKAWQYAFVLSGNTLKDTDTRYNTDTTEFTITGLQPNTAYDVYVRSICGVGDTSEWISATTTTCHAIPFAEEFDNVATEYPTGWTRYTSVTPSTLFSSTDPFESGTESTTATVWGYYSTYNANAFNGDPHVRAVITSSGYNYWLVSPQIEMTLADTLNATLTFDAALTAAYASTALTSANQYLYVVVSTDGGHTWSENNATIWSDALSNADHSLIAIPNGTGSNYTVNLTKYAGKTIRIAFGFGASTSGNSAALHLDNIHVNTTKDCMDEDELALLSSSTTSLELQIVNNNHRANGWQYIYGAKGFTRSDSVMHTLSTRSFTLTGLQAGKTYDVYVRTMCGTDTTAWAGPFDFTTNYGIPFTETFDNMSTVYCPAAWKRYKSIAADDLFAGTKSFATATEYTTKSTSEYCWGYNSTSSKYALSDANHITVELYRTYTGSWLVSPTIEVTNEEDKMLLFSFDAALTQYSSANAPTATATQKFYVAVSEDGGATWNRSNAIVWSDAEADSALYTLVSIPNGTGKEYVFDFTKYVGKQIQIAFGVEATSNDNYLHIDNISLLASDGYCFAPSGITKAESTTSSLKLNVVDDNTVEGWQYAYGKKGFKLSGQTTVYPTDGKEIELTDLNPGTQYDVYTRAICGVGDTSKWVGPYTFATEYGIPFSEPFDDMSTVYCPADWKRYKSIAADDLFAGTKSFATATEYAGTSTSENCWGYNSSSTKYALSDGNHISVELYKSFTGSWLVSPSIEVSCDEDKLLLFSFDAALTYFNATSAPNSTVNQKFYVAVSEDNGATWSRSNATLWSDATADSAMYSLSSIPNGAGTTYYFDFTKYAGKKIQIAFGIEATENDNRLHIDNVNLYVANSTCFGVNNMKQQTATGTSVTVSFTEQGSATQWQYACDANGFTFSDQTKIYSTDTTVFTVTGLQKETYYDVYVRSICAAGDTSAWTGPFVVKTAYGVPYLETFDDMATVFFPSDWAQYASITPAELFAGIKSFATATDARPTSTNIYWGYNKSYSENALTDANNLSTEIYSSTSNRWAVSPVIDLSAGAEANKTAVLSFDAALTKWNTTSAPTGTASQYFYVAISEDGGMTWLRSNATVWGPTTDDADYLLSDIPTGTGASYEIDLSKYMGKNVQFALGVIATSNDNRLYIDNFAVRQIETVTYTASTCNSSDYQDDHFSIARTDLKLGETTYTYKAEGQNGASDTAYILTLTVYPAVQMALYDTICQGYTYDQNGFNLVATSTTTIPMVYTSVNGCDSLVELHLEVIPTQYVDTTIYACQSYTYKGVTYYSDKIFTDTLVSSLGCDSIVRTFVRISSTGDTETEWRTSICSGDSYNDDVFTGLTKAGVYNATVQTAYGCDSTVTLYLLVADDSKAIYDTIRQADLPYMFEGEVFLGANTKVGDYTHDIQSSCGQVTLNMHVVSGTGISNTSAYSLQLTPNPARIGEAVQIVTDLHNASEYALTVISSTGQLVYESHTPALYMPGLPIAGIYTVRLVADGKVYQTRLLVK